MAVRCPASRPLGVARLARHRLAIMREGYATVLRDPRREVRGLLWDLALAEVPALDRYESVSAGLYAKAHLPVITEAGARRALVYLGANAGPGTPLPGYMEGVVAAARDLGLPERYVAELETMLPRGPLRTAEAGSHHAPYTATRPAVRPTRSSPMQAVPDRNAGWSWRP